jgi:hypothetical protein
MDQLANQASYPGSGAADLTPGGSSSRHRLPIAVSVLIIVALSLAAWTIVAVGLWGML